MKNLLSNKMTGKILLVLLVALIGIHIYVMSGPISYDKEYYMSGVVEGVEFESSNILYENNKMVYMNSNFSEPQEAYYYYKDGYFFTSFAKNEVEYKAEVDQINKNWDESLATPFYASKIDKMKITHEYEDTSITLICKSAVITTVLFTVAELAVAGLAIASFVYRRKLKPEDPA